MDQLYTELFFLQKWQHEGVPIVIKDWQFVVMEDLKDSPGPGCSKLTMSLVNISLNFQTLISRFCQYFLSKKCEKLLKCSAKASVIFSTKISVYLVIKS